MTTAGEAAAAVAPAVLPIGVAATVIAIVIAVFAILLPNDRQVRLDRRRPGVPTPPGALTAMTAVATRAVANVLERRGLAGLPRALEEAGVKMRRQDVVFLIIAGTLAFAALGLLFIGPGGLALGIKAPILAKLRLKMMASKRRRKFADQLDDALQLMSSSLRAGHSLPQALNSVAKEAEEPMAEEFSRVINETRVGRDMGEALDDTAKRMGSEDFEWVTQAIAINREVGGNLAEVLDGVGHTIRERNQIRRQVKALSAEGRLSAVILMGLPFVVALFILIGNPGYLLKFTQELIGFVMLGVAAVLLVVGGIWMRKTVQIRF